MDQLVMTRSRLFTLSEEQTDKCDQHGELMAEGWESGRKSSELSMYGVERDPKKQSFWKQGEVACCGVLGLNWKTDLDWTDKPDDGHDLKFRSRLIDVKTIELGKKLMIWPATKATFNFYRKKNFQWFVLVQGNGPTFTVTKAIQKAAFYCQKKVAPAGVKLAEGTWYMETQHLGDIERFFEIVGHP